MMALGVRETHPQGAAPLCVGRVHPGPVKKIRICLVEQQSNVSNND